MHEKFLLQALTLAKARRGFCAPNPSVGAVLVKNQKVISEGCHWTTGEPHAEQVALKHAGKEAQAATLYVTLEPCCHWGRTAPCTDVIINSGIQTLIYSTFDPNPQVNGKGIKLLQKAGINCQKVEVPVIESFYRSYYYWQKNKRPWVTAKLALSLDGKIAAAGGRPVAITGQALQQYTHQCRRQTDAILTTGVTLNHDDPQFNVRLSGEIIKKPVYVLDRTLSIREDLQIYQSAAQLCLFHASEDEDKIARLQEKGASCIKIDSEAHLNCQQVMDYVAKAGHHDLWLEAGGRCFESLLTYGHINSALFYISPKILGQTAYPAFQGAHDLLAQAKCCNWQKIDQEMICRLEIND